MKRLILALSLAGCFHLQATGQSGDASRYLDEGVALYDKGDYKGAIEQYKMALVIDPNAAVTHYELGSAYFALKDYTRAVEHADKAIALGGSTAVDAYILKGSALDLSDKPKEAIGVYKKGVSEFPYDHLLLYNLALTQYNVGEYSEAQASLEKALIIRPSHASSHLLLGVVMDEQGKRARSMLPLYHFLLLEPTGKRAESALSMLDGKKKQGVKKTGRKTTTIQYNPNGDEEGFSAAELMLSMLEASKDLESNKGKSEQELYCENSKSFISVLGELQKGKESFWWNFYVEYLYKLVKSEHAEAFCYYIAQSKGGVYSAWVTQHPDQIDALKAWVKRSGRGK